MQLQLLSTPFNRDYIPSEHTRLTTNFANLSQHPATRIEQIEKTLGLINERFNKNLGTFGEHNEPRYRITLDVITVIAKPGPSASGGFPISEMLRCRIHDQQRQRWLQGPIGFCYSSFVRDYDFNVLLPRIRNGEASRQEVSSFGDLHGVLYQLQFSHLYSQGVLEEPALIAISVAHQHRYQRTTATIDGLGMIYAPQGEESITSRYFGRMGLDVNYALAPGSKAPLAIYHQPNDLQSRSKLQLCALVAVMDTFQRIYRPEIYASHSIPDDTFVADLNNQDYEPTPIFYDRSERDQVHAPRQAQYAFDQFLMPWASELNELLQYHHALLASRPPVFP
ncbi:putative oxygenase MesX [Synechococcus sp. CCY9202]|uniref:putative oxygenase MesX n=1 Tax=Synechococcus sp. CCY9202 TaxID=174698 RepID=UPI002B1F2680|nr:putative oxygenase MesX [Synechococcus sp. CCY9202]MEA5422924.1 putative oxygenase MesX [Synechococcus sp. CCY9202]